jgi:hypothetical protein
MPEYLAPGVFIEETSFRAKSIEGVGTSVAGMVGPTRTGPLRGKPEVLTSFEEFQRIYGDARKLTLGGEEVINHTAIAAKSFFDNGGKQLYVTRVVKDVNLGGEDGAGTTAKAASAKSSSSDPVLQFTSRFPGAMGNYWLEARWRDSENVLKQDVVTTLEADETYVLDAAYVTKASFDGTVALADAKFPVTVRAVVTAKKVGSSVDTLEISALLATDQTGAPVAASDLASKLKLAAIAANPRARLLQAGLKTPALGKLEGTQRVSLYLRGVPGASEAPFLDTGWGSKSRFVGQLDVDAQTVTVKAASDGPTADKTLSLAELSACPSVVALSVRRSFDLGVRVGVAVKSGETVGGTGADQDDVKTEPGEELYTFAGVTTNPSDATNGIAARLLASPSRRYDRLTVPVACTVADGATESDIHDALQALFDDADSFLGDEGPDKPRCLVRLAGGSDGDAPGATDYAGETDLQKGGTGFASLEDVDDVSIVMIPAAAAIPGDGDGSEHLGVILEMQKHCRKMRYRVGLVDSRKGMSISEVRELRSELSDDRLALYYPWVVIADPNGINGDIMVPPAGFLAGIYAYTDVQRGVHKAPANEVVVGAKRFEVEINRFQQEVLNPDRVNCLRALPGLGMRVWGSRTLSIDSEWMYVNVRRYFLYLEKSIEKSTQWVVFEPNGEQLWDNVRNTVDQFLFNEWRQGRLLGSSPKEAYFVRCDRSTMTQNDLDNGRLVCLIGAAPLRPAEFVIFRIGQKTADASS